MATCYRLLRRHPVRLAACGLALLAVRGVTLAAEEPPHSAALDEAIVRAAHRHGVPEKLVRRIVMRESRYNPRARNHSFWGLMQISYPTAKSMGFKGSPSQLLDPMVNLRYAVPYLANAFEIAGKSEDAAVRLYASGYYATAKARGLLSGLRTADSAPLAAGTDDPAPVAVASAAPAPDYGIFGSLFGAGQQPQTTQVASAEQPQGVQAQDMQAQDMQAQATQAAAPAPASVALPEGKSSDDSVDLTPDRKGVLHPPKKWLRDGGITSIAQGEQSIEQVEANQRVAAADDHAERHRRSAPAKVTTFAALEAPPTGAQAYAGAGTQDPRLLQADSQAAITQVTSGQAATPAAAAQPAQVDAAAEEPAKKKARGHAARRHRHDATDAVAKSGEPAPGVQAVQSQPEPQAAQGQPEPQATQGDPAAQPAPALRTADGGGTDAAASAPQQASAPAEAADTASKPKHHTRHAHAKKKAAAESVAAQQPQDNQPTQDAQQR